MTEFHPGRVLSTSVLVLNRHYLPVHVTSARRAFGLLYCESAEIVHIEDGRYLTYDFATWCELSAFRAFEQKSPHEDWVRAIQYEIQVPRIVRLFRYERVPRKALKFNRRNIFARDGNRCQYCGRAFPFNQLSLDHVVPKCRGGSTAWDNVVCSCVTCNTHKGSRTPQEAHMRLIAAPCEPKTNPVIALKLKNPKYESWRSFVPVGSAALETA